MFNKNFFKGVLVLSVVTVLMNVPFWILSQVIYINRPVISYDFLFALLLMSISTRLALLYLTTSFFGEIISISAFNYQFSNASDFILTVNYLQLLEVAQWFTIYNVFYALVIIGALVVIVLSSLLIRKSKVNVRCVVVFILFIFISDIQVGSNVFRPQDSIIFRYNLAGSQMFSLVISQLGKKQQAYSNTAVPIGDSVLDLIDIYQWAEMNPLRSILFVIVESYGHSNIEELNMWVSAPLSHSEYTLKRSLVAFRGATTSGELRSLCSLSASYLTVKAANVSECLPNRLQKLGWSTVSFHGFSRAMFDRFQWWKQIGFTQSVFVEDIHTSAENRCGSIFKGVCDRHLLALAMKSLQRPKSFVYVLTLDTHLPVAITPLRADISALCEKNALDMVPCMHFQNIRNTIEVTMQQVQSMTIKPLVVVIGDHAPPFQTLEYRDLFHDSVVPAFVLIPK